MLKKIASTFLVFLTASIFVLILAEWMVGCGELIHAADGTWRTGECLILESSGETGRWK
jgi:hypothetical protein